MKKRTMTICVSDIPKNRIITHENGKKYLAIETWDYNDTDDRDNDFSVSISFNKFESDLIKNGKIINRVYIGNGKIIKQF